MREYGHDLGLINDEIYQNFLVKKSQISELETLLEKTKITPTKEINAKLTQLETSPIKDSITLKELLKRPEITITSLENFIDLSKYDKEVKKEVEINISYEGYIKKATKDALKMLDLETKSIPDDINYHLIPNIASEALEKLEKIRPLTLGQASRISGVNPADIAILSIYLKKRGMKTND